MNRPTIPPLLNTASLADDDLDFWVLVALGFQVKRHGGITSVIDEAGVLCIEAGDPCAAPHVRSFCRQWETGGPLIEALHIGLVCSSEVWTGRFQGFESLGPTPLVAAMRSVVQRFIRAGKPVFALDMLSESERTQVYALVSPPRPADYFTRQDFQQGETL